MLNTMLCSEKKVALITGVLGHDGVYLAAFLLDKGYFVHVIKKQGYFFNSELVSALCQDSPLIDRHIILHDNDSKDSTNLSAIIQKVQPDEIYNLGAQSLDKRSNKSPEYCVNVDELGILRILEAVRLLGLTDKCRIYHGSSSEISSLLQEEGKDKVAPFCSSSSYALSQLYEYWTTVNYRDTYQMYACNAILLNHESPLEAAEAHKIIKAIARIALGMQDRLYLENLSVQRKWGNAKDYVEAIWLTLQQNKAADHVIDIGLTSTIREFIRLSFAELGIEVEFCGRGEQEKGVIIDIDEERLANLNIDKDAIKFGQTVVKIGEPIFSPLKVDFISMDTDKTKIGLKWTPKYDLGMLINEMMYSGLSQVREEEFSQE
ncbi:GDP-mannose 4,6-dehydratase [Sphingobacterium faecium]|uniref:GDP-mannose 4,6-dehydratase n=1 Tax=Sphingobacterium faecium TaxID=34087 RepID=UPI00246990A2|nr:GDP-mannose 4,6-dehydratase [Sphingobacterium faecium]MDH5828192.1 GDP-mannose 4,6-dehydratase [Sphingobacterium faecium]